MLSNVSRPNHRGEMGRIRLGVIAAVISSTFVLLVSAAVIEELVGQQCLVVVAKRVERTHWIGVSVKPSYPGT